MGKKGKGKSKRKKKKKSREKRSESRRVKLMKRLLKMSARRRFGWVEKHYVPKKGKYGPYYVYRYRSGWDQKAIYLGRGKLAERVYKHMKSIKPKARRLRKRIFYRALKEKKYDYDWARSSVWKFRLKALKRGRDLVKDLI